MLNFTSDQLFNCCTRFAPPDWSELVSLELGACRTESQENGDEFTIGGLDRDKAEFFTVYARDKEGYADAITDIPKFFAGCLIMAELSRISGLPASVVC
ncbi:hypothetical protein [Brucella sp.]|uniref:hypothetical protein n=1 Tax=Brucella sp. TaxID=52132 RepID=UPI0028AAAFE5|nr:hypothetical protein [Brucella sp.]